MPAVEESTGTLLSLLATGVFSMSGPGMPGRAGSFLLQPVSDGSPLSAKLSPVNTNDNFKKQAEALGQGWSHLLHLPRVRRVRGCTASQPKSFQRSLPARGSPRSSTVRPDFASPVLQRRGSGFTTGLIAMRSLASGLLVSESLP